MALIQVDPTRLTQMAGTLGGKIEDFTQLNARLSQLIDRIGDSWEGEASQSYLRVMRGYADQTHTMLRILEEFRAYAIRAAEEFSQKDQGAASRLRNCF